MREDIRIVPTGRGRDPYMPLLLLADDSESEVSGYYQKGDLYAFDDAASRPLGVILAIAEPDGSVELKAVAVHDRLQGQGIGKRMLSAVLADLKERDVERVIVGTASCSIGVLAFYQKVGFRFWRIERDFFSTARGYPAGLQENGIPLRDMVWMDQEL